MSTGTMSYAMDQLVFGARASRDAAFNTLDAINRRTKAVSDKLEADARQFFSSIAQPAKPDADPAKEPERDSRFDPEDEWDLSSPGGADRAAPATQPPRPSAAAGDEDDYPETWLR